MRGFINGCSRAAIKAGKGMDSFPGSHLTEFLLLMVLRFKSYKVVMLVSYNLYFFVIRGLRSEYVGKLAIFQWLFSSQR